MITGEALLQQAEAWVAGGNEAAWRSGVSRAYYGAFHVARTFLAKLGFRTPKADQAHAYLSRRLLNCGDDAVQQAGSDLGALRGDRNRADYHIEKNLFQRDSQLLVAAARRIVRTLDSAIEAARLQAIVQAIRDYERDVLREETWQTP